jgi:hypothetical protein
MINDRKVCRTMSVMGILDSGTVKVTFNIGDQDW